MKRINLQNTDSQISSKKLRLYKITADYRPHNINKPKYYVVGKTAKEAKEKFNNRITWLKIYECEEVVDEKDIADVMLNPARHIIIK